MFVESMDNFKEDTKGKEWGKNGLMDENLNPDFCKSKNHTTSGSGGPGVWYEDRLSLTSSLCFCFSHLYISEEKKNGNKHETENKSLFDPVCLSSCFVYLFVCRHNILRGTQSTLSEK